jgi:hypothetical protein
MGKLRGWHRKMGLQPAEEAERVSLEGDRGQTVGALLRIQGPGGLIILLDSRSWQYFSTVFAHGQV